MAKEGKEDGAAGNKSIRLGRLPIFLFFLLFFFLVCGPPPLFFGMNLHFFPSPICHRLNERTKEEEGERTETEDSSSLFLLLKKHISPLACFFPAHQKQSKGNSSTFWSSPLQYYKEVKTNSTQKSKFGLPVRSTFEERDKRKVPIFFCWLAPFHSPIALNKPTLLSR